MEKDKKIVTPFKEVIEKAGGIGYLFEFEFLASVALSAIAIVVLVYTEPQSSFLADMIKLFMTVCGALLGFVIAAYAIILSAGSDRFKEGFSQSSYYSQMKVDFCLTSILAGACIILSIFAVMLVGYVPVTVAYPLFTVTLFLFLWTVLMIVVLVASAIRILGDFIVRVG